MSDLDTAVQGLTVREHAAIHLKVPMSGNDELDAMILASQRDELYHLLCANGMQGATAFCFAKEAVASLHP